ncbi:MAG: phosphoglucosamine mutase [Verrucomicrobiota bacterium]
MTSTTRQFFGTDGIRGMANVEPLTPETALRLGQAAAEVLLKDSKSLDWPRCIIGRDTRSSGDMLEAAFAAGMASVGVDVQLAGVIPTPAVAYLTRTSGAAVGVVISASHNPFHDNGIKFFGGDGYKLADATELAIEASLLSTDRVGESARAKPGKVGRISELEGAVDQYIHSVIDGLSTDTKFLSGIKVALDCANGASSKTSPAVLEHLGAELEVRFNEPNGVNINADCGATHDEAISAMVRESGAQVGISHDGDADRLIMCDETGDALDGDEVLAIAATSLAKRGLLTTNSIVATVMSNFGLNDTLYALGGEVIRTAVGDRYVIEAMQEKGLNVGGEQSGHLIFHDFSTTGDGIVAAVQILQIMAAEEKPLSELRKCLTKFPQAKRNLSISSKPPVEELEAASQIIAETEAKLGSAGRVLLRYSGTEPKIRLLIEGRDADYIEGQAEEIANAILEQIG